MTSALFRPIPADRFGYAQAHHLLHRAGFGGTPAQVQALVAMGPDKAVDYLVDYESIDVGHLPEADVDADIMRPMTAQEREERRRAARSRDEQTLAKFRSLRQQAQRADRRQLAEMQRWWLDRMIATPRPLEEKLTLLWHGHFAVNYRGCEDAYLIYRQNEMFRANANGDFGQMVRNIVRDPAMLVFLNNDSNRKGRPNENLARELMELFTLGEGNYTEADIKQGARALTGYTRHDNDFAFRRFHHDTGDKKLLGKHGPLNGDHFANLCLAQPACARFVAYKLYQHFVADLPKPAHVEGTAERAIDALAMVIRKSRYQLKPALKMIFAGEHFYSDDVRGAKIKSPVELTVGLVRTLRTPQRSGALLSDALRVMGQELFNPPNVAGWPGGRSWINTSTLFIRQNLATYLITGKPPFRSGWSKQQINYDAMPLVSDLKPASPGAVADRLLGTLLGDAATPARRRQLLQFMAEHDNRMTNDSVIAMLCLITAMPEYQLV